MSIRHHATRLWAWLGRRFAYDPMNAAGKLALSLVTAGSWSLWGHAVAMIVAGVLLGTWYVYLELYMPLRGARRGDS